MQLQNTTTTPEDANNDTTLDNVHHHKSTNSINENIDKSDRNLSDLDGQASPELQHQSPPPPQSETDILPPPQSDTDDIPPPSQSGTDIPPPHQSESDHPLPPISDVEAKTNHKKRKIADLQSESTPSRSASRPPSPPWKKFGAEGPTAFLDNGKRRSGRVNILPLELQPSTGKRTTRSAIAQHTPVKDDKKTQQPPPARRESSRPSLAASRPVTKSAHQTPNTNGEKRETSSELSELDDVEAPQPELIDAPNDSSPRKTSTRLRRPSRAAQEGAQQDVKPKPKSKPVAKPVPKPAVEESPRIRLKLRRTETSFVTQHPSHIPRVPQFETIAESLAALDARDKEEQRLAKIDDKYEGLERARPANDNSDPSPFELAEREARIRLRILEAAEPGGPLSEERCSVYFPDVQPEPVAQFAHMDHLWSQGAFFRVLMDRERKTHVDNAKKIAIAALAKWKEKQPQTEEEKEQEERIFFQTVYKQLVKDMARKWELVGEEIGRRRHAKWEVEEKIRREKRMQEVMERSTNLLDARKAARESREESLVSADGTDEIDYDDADTRADASDEDTGIDSDVMSSSDSDSEEEGNADDPDANLSPEALRRKYAALPELSDEEEGGDDQDEDDDADDQKAGLSRSDSPLLDNNHTGDSDAEEGAASPSRDYANIQLEEVDENMLDDSDESIDMSDEDMTSEDDDEDEQDAGTDEDDDDEEEDVGLLGLLTSKERKLVQEAEDQTDIEAEEETSPPEEMDDVTLVQSKAAEKQLVPATSRQIDAATHPAVAGDIDNDLAETSDTIMQDAHSDNHPLSGSPEHNMLSVDSHGEDRSSQLSPKDDTTIDPTDAESTTSVELEGPDKEMHSSEQASPPSAQAAPRTPVPAMLRGTLREYQHEGLDWLAKLYANQTNGILADEMGLGKTIQTIALLAHLAEVHEIWGPHLIVVPTSVILNWEMEFKKFLPGFKVLSYYGTLDERIAKRKGWSNPDNYNVVITSYQLILKDINSIKVPEWHYMILDEAHNIKNFNSQRYRAMIRLKTHARLLLTGTPLQNNMQELWSLLTFLTAGHDGQGMGELHEFEEWFSKPVNEIFADSRQVLSGEAQKIVNKLHHSLRPYLLRRLKAHVEKQLPGKYEHTVLCRLSKRQRQLYDAFMGLSDTKAKLLSGNMVSVSMALMALRKVCNHPDLFEERPIVTSFAMPKPFSRMPRAAIADYEIKEQLVRRDLLFEDPTSKLDLNYLSLNLASRESSSSYHVRASKRLRASAVLYEIVRRESLNLPKDSKLDGSSIASVLSHQNRRATIQRLDKLRHYANLTKHRTELMPVYGTDLVERLTIRSASDRLLRSPPRRRASHMDWYMSVSDPLQQIVKSLPQRADEMQPFVAKFACITPNVVAENLLAFTTPESTINAIRSAAQHDLLSPTLTKSPLDPPAVSSEIAIDPYHEARVRLSIAFPDKRLLQYDCGKLQRLALLLRSLTSKGSRALIFTQMTAVLNILESFLNIHGYRYLRLDGSTKIEARQDMMERFNRDTRIDVFILSSRSGGVGMNLTGADTVIFYDLDWNPQMDRQCQDRAHRIGQMRDVHIYKFVSESTIEVNILKKSNQKRLLDEVVIQEGEFTTDWFNRPDPADDQKVVGLSADGDDVAGAAVDKFFGSAAGSAPGMDKVLESVEDAEDVLAARGQQEEMRRLAADFDLDDQGVGSGTKTSTPRTMSVAPSEAGVPGHTVVQGDIEMSTTLDAAQVGEDITEAQQEEIVVKGDGREEEVKHVDEYMLRFVEDFALKNVMYTPPVDKKRARLDKTGRDRSHRPRNRTR